MARAKKLGRPRRGEISINKIPREGRENTFIKDWKLAIEKLMKDFCFEEWQMESVIEKAKESFLITDTEYDKYNKAWKFFREEMMLAI